MPSKSSTTSTHLTFPKYANFHGYSDIEPYEVIRVISDKTLEIRAMKTSDCPVNMKDIKCYVGGFAGHFANQRIQQWNIESNPNGYVTRIRLTKKGWRNGSLKFILEDKPVKFYDYNF